MNRVGPAVSERSTPPAPRPTGRARTVILSLLAGVLLAVVWSYEFVDSVIGENVADTLLGYEAKTTAIGGTAAGLFFALVSGFAGTFTACNIAMAAALGPMGGLAGQHRWRGLRALARPVGYLLLGMLAVSVTYGFVGVLLGDALPQLSSATAGGVPVRLIQSSVVFGVIGLALLYLGFAALGMIPDVFRDRPRPGWSRSVR